MYELNTAQLGTLAATGASVAQAWVGAWTLFVAGLAAVAVARVAVRRRALMTTERPDT